MNKTEVIREFMQMLDDGVLVRDVSNDDNRTAFVRQGLRIINVVAAANEILSSEPLPQIPERDESCTASSVPIPELE